MKKALLGILGTAALAAAVFFLYRTYVPGTSVPKVNANHPLPFPPNAKYFPGQFAEFILPDHWSCELISESPCSRFVCEDKSSPPADHAKIVAFARLVLPGERELRPSITSQIPMECGPRFGEVKDAETSEREINGHRWIETSLPHYPTPEQLTHVLFTKALDVFMQVELSAEADSEAAFEARFGNTIQSLRPARKAYDTIDGQEPGNSRP